MGFYNAFAESIRRRLAFIDRFRGLAGVSSGTLARIEWFISDEIIDNWILDEFNQAINAVLYEADDELLTLVIRQSQVWAKQLAGRLAARPEYFGAPISTHFLNSDPHISGLPILIVFETGAFVYKPRPVKLDAAYNRFTDLVRSMGAQYLPETVSVIDCGDHGFIEYVNPRSSPVDLSPSEIRSIGSLLAIIYLFAGKDFHYENIIFSHEGGATLIDLEGLLQPEIVQESSSVDQFASILSTGVLPARISSGSITNFDPSIIGSKLYNLGPHLSTAAILFMDGFTNTYECMLTNREIIRVETFRDGLNAASTRYIASNTLDYYRAISRFIHQDSLGNGNKFIGGIYSSSVSGRMFLDYEKTSVARLCIPIFYSDNATRAISTEEGDVIPVEVQINGFEKATDRLRVQMSDEDLVRQLWFIVMSFELYAKNGGIEWSDVGERYEKIVGMSPESIYRVAEYEFKLLHCFLKMSGSGKHTLVYPSVEDGMWVIRNRKLLPAEIAIQGVVVECLHYRLSAGIVTRRSRLTELISQLRELDANETPSALDEMVVDGFKISASSGPCSDLFDVFLASGKDTNVHCFVDRYNAAVVDREVIYRGGIRSRCLGFRDGTMCLIASLLIVAFMIEETAM